MLIRSIFQILQNDQLMKGNGSQDQNDGERFALNQSPTSSKKSCSCWRIGNPPIAGSSGPLSSSCHHRVAVGAMTRESRSACSTSTILVVGSRLDRATNVPLMKRTLMATIPPTRVINRLTTGIVYGISTLPRISLTVAGWELTWNRSSFLHLPFVYTHTCLLRDRLVTLAEVELGMLNRGGEWCTLDD